MRSEAGFMKCSSSKNKKPTLNLNIPAYKSASGQRTSLYRATSIENSPDGGRGTPIWNSTGLLVGNFEFNL